MAVEYGGEAMEERERERERTDEKSQFAPSSLSFTFNTAFISSSFSLFLGECASI
jgi:hypothetical protein